MILTEQVGLLQIGRNIWDEPRLMKTYPNGTVLRLCSCGNWHDYTEHNPLLGLKNLRAPSHDDWRALWGEATQYMWPELEAVCPPELYAEFRAHRVPTT